MNESALPTTASQQLVEELLAVCGSLKQENESLKAQPDWFKRQLFGQKSDGNSVYDSYRNNRDDITLARCWVHARRYFIKSKQAEPAATGQALSIIGDLYKTEAVIRDKTLTGSDKKAFRQLQAKPAVDAFFSWCQNERQRIDLTPQNPLTKAISYACNHQQQMRVFLEEPDVSPDTNHLKRALRCIPMGRENDLFCWVELGREHVGIVQSLLVTCRLQGIDPYRYLVVALQRISLHPARQVDDLNPRPLKLERAIRG